MTPDFKSAYRLAWSAVHRCGSRYAIPEGEKEEIVQEGVLKAWQLSQGCAIAPLAYNATRGAFTVWADKRAAAKRMPPLLTDEYINNITYEEKGVTLPPDYARIEDLINNRLPTDKKARRAAQEKRRYHARKDTSNS